MATHDSAGFEEMPPELLLLMAANLGYEAATREFVHEIAESFGSGVRRARKLADMDEAGLTPWSGFLTAESERA